MGFSDQLKGVQSDFNARGFTPFKFSSRKTQVNSSQLGGLIPNNPVSDLLNESMSWYEMWINPSKVNLSRQFQQQKQHTAGSIVTYHFRPDTWEMSVSGFCGWIAILPFEQPQGLLTTSPKKIFADPAKNNSPRVFLNRLRDIAQEAMYFVDLNGVEHYNTKYIKIYTKQFPNGMICEGYYKNFNIPEDSEDAQTIAYDFTFTVENFAPITALQKMSGMFGGGQLGGTLRALPGLQ